MLRLISRSFATGAFVKPRKTTAPKVPVTGMKISPFALFVKENFKSQPKAKNTEVIKQLSVQWGRLEVADRQKYEKQSEEFQKQKLDDFHKLSAAEQDALISEAKEKKEEKASRRRAKERREKRKLEGRPKVPPSAYALFVKEKLVGSGHEAKEKLKAAVGEWNAFSAEQKKKYTDEAKKLSDEYHVVLKKWEAERKAVDEKPE